MSVLCLISLSGCSKLVRTLNENGADVAQTDEPSVEPTPFPYTMADLVEAKGVSKEDKDELRGRSEGRFYYELLSEDEKELYLEIFVILSNMDKEIMVSSLDMDEIEKVFGYVLNDHPELFYIDGFEFRQYSSEDETVGVAVGGSYCMSPEEVEQKVTVMTDYIARFIEALDEKVSPDAGDYERIKFTYEYIISNTEYDIEAENNQNIISVMEGGRSVCQGYAKTTQLLLQILGIDATLVVGKTEGEHHAWNLVKSDGEYYLLDTTWGDASYMVATGEESLLDSIPPIGYDYLLFNNNMDRGVHDPTERDIIPPCTATTDNYYFREGLFFESVDKNQIGKAFKQAYSRGDEYVVLKMNNNQVYKDMLYYLIGDQHAFDYVKGKKSVNYAQSPQRLYLVFWL